MMIGLVRIFFALAAYRNVLSVSEILDFAGDIHAIYNKMKKKLLNYIINIFYRIITINVTPFPAKLSANNLVSLLSR